MAQLPVYLNPQMPIEERVEDALSKMTIEEKVAMTHAQSKFSSAGVPRLGIPENWMTDGPHGIRAEVMWDEWYGANWTNDSCIAFPALTCLAATWSTDMSALYGKSIGEEARYRNKNVLLGPGINIYRTPLNGRNFEYMGEDPYLASIMVVPYVREVQKNGVAACVKHFALNNQEINRDHIDVKLDDRALHEIYLPAFKASVQEGEAWAMMGAYNTYKGEHCCHNQYLLNDILKRDWGFDGVVISDWGGVHDTDEAIKNGLDMEFGSWTNGLNWGASNAYDNYYLSKSYLKKLKDGEYTDKELNDKVRRILRLVFRTNMDPNRPYGSFGTKEHADAGLLIAQEGMVLLQNNKNILPIESAKVKKILVVGENADKRMTVGGGSSSLKAKYEISPLAGIMNRAGTDFEVKYVVGYESPAVKEQDVLNAADPNAKEIDYVALRNEAVKEAKDADLVIFVGGLNKNDGQDCEGNDRSSLSLPYHQDELVSALAKANPNIVAVIVSGNAVSMPWAKQVPGIIEAWYSGTESGNALASIIFGDVNPSGKLPFTFYSKLEDCGAHVLGDHPGTKDEVNYNEGIFVGYRWTDMNKKSTPTFAFGHGLSYTTFKYGKVVLDRNKIDRNGKIIASVDITNTGKREGKEIVQLYISDKKSSLPRPVKELKGFEKINLKPGETKRVNFEIDINALSFYNDVEQKWVAENGDFDLLIGASAADIKGKSTFTLVD